MSDKTTQITLKDDSPIGISSVINGANINGVGFNLDLIARKNPTLAASISSNYDEARKISPDDPPHPDEDFDLALDDLSPFKS